MVVTFFLAIVAFSTLLKIGRETFTKWARGSSCKTGMSRKIQNTNLGSGRLAFMQCCRQATGKPAG